MDVRASSITIRATLVVIAAGVVMFGLYAGQSFIIPLVIAFIIANILEALIERLRRICVPALLAYVITLAIVLALFAAFIFVILDQIEAFAAALPDYQQRFAVLFDQFRSYLQSWNVPAEGLETLDRFAERLDIASVLSNAVGSVGSVVANTLLVGLYVGFLLAEQGRTFERIAALGENEKSIGNIRAALAAVSDGLRKYLYLKTILSALTAIFSYAVLRFYGLDFAETWGLLVFLLNFIPTLGSMIAVMLPSALAIVQFESIVDVLVMITALTIVQVSIGNVLEPMYLGQGLNLRPFVVIVSLVFWSGLWGVAGAFLAVPLTAGMTILCREIQGLGWVATLLSEEDDGPARR